MITIWIKTCLKVVAHSLYKTQTAKVWNKDTHSEPEVGVIMTMDHKIWSKKNFWSLVMGPSVLSNHLLQAAKAAVVIISPYPSQTAISAI